MAKEITIARESKVSPLNTANKSSGRDGKTRGYQDYHQYVKDPDYSGVEYDQRTGAIKATHKDHNFDKKKGWYEKIVRDVGFANGYSVVLESEKGKSIGENYTEGLWNGRRFELASCENPENNNNLVKGMKHCASKDGTEVAVLFLPNSDFKRADIERAIGRYDGLGSTLGEKYKSFKGIYVVSGYKVYKMR